MTVDRSESISDGLRMQILDGACMLTLNRLERRNALTPELARGLADQIGHAGRDRKHNTVFLRGAGGHFCVGLDLKWVQSHESGLSRSAMVEGLAAFQDVVRAIVGCPLPVVAILEGSVAGIGLDIAAACDLRIAATSLSIHSAFAKMGLVPDGGSTYTLPRLVGQANALNLLLGSTPVDAARALEMGLVTEVANEDHIDTKIADCARLLTAQSRNSLIRIKQLVRHGELDALNARLLLEGEAQLEALASEEFNARLRSFASS